jgi:hypothetical protein
MAEHQILSAEVNVLIIVVCCFVGLCWAVINAIYLSRTKLVQSQSGSDSYNKFVDEENYVDPKTNLILEVASYIERGSNAFLFM